MCQDSYGWLLTPHGAAVVTDERESVPGHIIGGVDGNESPFSSADADEQGAGDDYRSNISGENAGHEVLHLRREMATVDRRMAGMEALLYEAIGSRGSPRRRTWSSDEGSAGGRPGLCGRPGRSGPRLLLPVTWKFILCKQGGTNYTSDIEQF